MFEDTIIQEIIDAWSADQAHPYKDRKQKPLPDPQDTRIVLEKAFLASLKREEEKPITFSITLLNRDCVDKEEKFSGRKQLIKVFTENLPFTVDTIVKIAPAFSPKTTSLIVAPKDKTRTEYEIWGVMFYRPSKNRFNETPVGFDEFNYLRPDVITVTAISPGSLMISRGNSAIGRFLSGKFEKAIPTPFQSSAMGQYIMDIVKTHSGYEQFKNQYWVIYRDTLLYLLSEASTRGHGGMIILIPSKMAQHYENFITSKYTFKENFSLEDLLIRLLNQGNNNIAVSLAMNRIVAERIEFFAQLSCIDGALILTNELRLLSFGSTLNAKPWSGNVVIGPDGFNDGGKRFDASKHGTKHNSAVNFVGAYPDSIAFVISQDGPVRGFICKDEKTILCWPDCLVSMFV